MSKTSGSMTAEWVNLKFFLIWKIKEMWYTTVLKMNGTFNFFLNFHRLTKTYTFFSSQELKHYISIKLHVKNFSATTICDSEKMPTHCSGELSSVPLPPNEHDCCGNGCPNCVWLMYVTDIKNYYKSDEKLQEAINTIPPGFVREFVKTELKHLIEES